MTNRELDQARIDEAYRQAKECPGQGQNFALIVARLAREGWTPELVDPDIAEARIIQADKFFDRPTMQNAVLAGAHDAHPEMVRTLQAIKRGRELEREAQPGMVWVKHDGSRQSPVPGALVTVSLGHSHYQTDQSFMIDWWLVSHYAIITQPEEK